MYSKGTVSKLELRRNEVRQGTDIVLVLDMQGSLQRTRDCYKVGAAAISRMTAFSV